MAPEDNPADDVQPTQDEWEECEREREACRIEHEADTQQIRMFREVINQKRRERGAGSQES